MSSSSAAAQLGLIFLCVGDRYSHPLIPILSPKDSCPAATVALVHSSDFFHRIYKVILMVALAAILHTVSVSSSIRDC
jgi:hypothetical protein